MLQQEKVILVVDAKKSRRWCDKNQIMNFQRKIQERDPQKLKQ